ncbi:MAG: hypothetical protein L6R35_004911, partial [Caloplaca aegaea]
VTLESEEGLESWVAIFFFLSFLGEELDFGGAMTLLEEWLSLLDEGEEEPGLDLRLGRVASFDPVTAAGAGVSASEPLLEVSEDSDEESAAVLLFFVSLLFGVALAITVGFSSAVLAFLGAGLSSLLGMGLTTAVGFPSVLFTFLGAGSSSPLDEAEVEDAVTDFFRFKLLSISCDFDFCAFREDDPRPAVSFSSSASLSELEVDDEDRLGVLDFLDLLAFVAALGGIGTLSMLTSESLSLLLSSLLCPASSALLSLLLLNRQRRNRDAITAFVARPLLGTTIMDAREAGQRMRAPPNGNTNSQPRQVHLQQNAGSAAVNGSHPPRPPMSRAERFEDEKKRIIDSCFSKTDTDGSVTESYITHLRVTEDAAYPSSPPPPTAGDKNKKERIIIVAVRKTGRVRMHKARENPNNTFSIGKTWNLDDLNAIQSFTNATPITPEDQQNKQSAGSVGFIVTITKPYYWQASTAKEKEFFIFSLIKIFKKYTGGRLPELIGFDHQEMETFSGAIGPPAPAQRPPRPASPRQESESSARSISTSVSTSRPPPSLQSSRQPSEQHAQPYPPSMGQPVEQLPPPRSEHRPPLRSEDQRHPSQERSFQARPSLDRPQQDRSLKTMDSEERIAQIPGSFPSSDFVRNLKPETSQSQLRNRSFESSTPRDEDFANRDPSLDRPTTSSSRDPSQNEPPYRVLHSARSGDDRVRQNGNQMYGSQQAMPSRPNQVPMPFGAGSQSSRPSQESIQERGRPSTADPGEGSAVPRNIRSTSSTEESKPPTSDGSSRGRSKEQWYSVPDPSKAYLHPPNLKRAASSEASNYEESRSQPAVKVTTLDITPPTAEENVEPGPGAVLPSQSAIPTPPETPTEAHRPGLGPMIKAKRSNKEIASSFRKAATAYNSFKPRAGGAADKLREQQQSPTEGPDGITGVVPAPSLLKGVTQTIPNQSRSQTPDLKMPEQAHPQVEVPMVTVDSPPRKPSPRAPVQLFDRQSQSQASPLDTEFAKPPLPDRPPEEQRRNRKSDHSNEYARALALDPQILAGRTFDIETSLNDFGWGEEASQRCSYEDLQANVRKEVARAEAGGWLNSIKQNDDRIVALGGMMDRVIGECEELDGLLTLYGVELSTLSEDVAYIEAQSQGLQVQAANQKLLHTELKALLDTISISSSDLRSLKDASLTKPQGIYTVETTLSRLYSAMLTIDPKSRHTGTPPRNADGQNADRRASGSFANNELSSMRAIREKKDVYQLEIKGFVQRFKQYMAIKFRETESQINDKLERNKNTGAARNPAKLDYRLREGPKLDLWTYSPLLLFSREMEPHEWEDLIRLYESSAKRPYQEEFRDNVFHWKRLARKPRTDEQEVLFTSQEKDTESLVGRKLTVKRSKTIRSEASHRISSGDKPKDGKVDAYEAFSGALNEMARLVFIEQNFITDLFHLTSARNPDFNDAVSGARPDARTGSDLTEKKLFEPDRDLARRLHSTLDEIYSFWPTDLQNLVDWVIKQDHLQGVGVIAALESKLSEFEETNQEYLTQTVSKIHDRLIAVFNRFVDDQLHGIEDTKVKIKKRKGVIAFMKIFPNFSLALEAMLPRRTQLPIRTLVDEAYRKINRAMFESLKFIAKESPTAGQGIPSGGDPEDKEALNYHILLIENMNHYIEEVYAKENAVLSQWKEQAQLEMAEHMDLYLAAVLRRPLGKLLDFVESVETQLKELQQDQQGQIIATRASHSRSVFKKVLATYDAKEIRKGIDALKKRVEKHFGEADDVSLSRGLVTTVLKECERRYVGVGERTRRLVRDVYEGSVEVEWRDEDVVSAFRR